MFRLQTYLTNACLASFDLSITALCYVIVWQVEFNPDSSANPWWNPDNPQPLLTLGVVLLLWLSLSAYFRLYHSRRLDSPFADAAPLLKIGFTSWMVGEGIAHFLPAVAPPPSFRLHFTLINTLALVAARLVLRLQVRWLRRRGWNVKNLVLVATSELGNRVAEKVEQRAHFGYRITHRLVYSGTEASEGPRLMDELRKALASGVVNDVLLGLPANATDLTAELVRECESRGVSVRIVPDLFPLVQSDTQVYDLDGIPLINVRLYPTEYLRYAVLKRVFDISASLAVLLLFSPLYLLIALLIKLSSQGPVLFAQERVGLNGRTFRMLKFRTMRSGPNPETHWTVPNDPHVTPVGRGLRRSNLDELPQFLNVLAGDMSIVGPRPERPFFLERFRREVPEYMARHYVKSGITGWAQVNGWRGDTSIPQRIEHDLYYIRNWAMAFDLKIVFLTMVRSFFHRNAY